MLRALGPWTGPDTDKEFASLSGWHPSDVIEGQVYHNTNDEAGTVILIVLGAGPGERILECKGLACEDGYYDWYVFESGDVQNPGFTLLRMVARTMSLPSSTENQSRQSTLGKF